MPNISEMKSSKFLTRADCGRGILVTIRGCDQQNVAKEGAPPEMKWCLHFDEQDKPMVLNSTNSQLCAQICGSPETDHWVGHKIVCYDDPSISFQGKLVGGIRVRAPRSVPSAPVGQAAPTGGAMGSVDRAAAANQALAPARAAAPTPVAAPTGVDEDLPF